MKGKELYDEIKTLGNYTEKKAADLFKQLINAIAYMHSKGVCHRDLKPHNVLVTEDGNTVKITDFNVSKGLNEGKSLDDMLLGNDSELLRMHTKTGTLAFSAPEMITDFSYNEKVDIWSAGTILYTMLSGM